MEISDIPIGDIISPELASEEENVNVELQTFMLMELTDWVQSGQASENDLATIDNLSESVKGQFSASDSDVSFSVHYGDNDHVLNVVEQGTGELYSGGDNGMVTELDGTRRPSEVPERFWGTRVEWLERDGIQIKQNIEIRMKALVPDKVRTALSNASSQIANWLKQNMIVPMLQERMAAT